MNKSELIKEVSEFIQNEVIEEDGEVDLGLASASVAEFIDGLDAEDAEDESETEQSEK